MSYIKPPSRGEPITAAWARKVTAAANRTNGASSSATYGARMRFDSPSEFAFKVSRHPGFGQFVICLPPGCVTMGAAVAAVAVGLEPATAPLYTRDESGEESLAKNVPIDGRFDHVYPLALGSGEIAETGRTTIYGLVKAADGGYITSFVAQPEEDSPPTDGALAVFVVAHVENTGGSSASSPRVWSVEQVTRGAVHLGGSSSARVVDITGGDAASGYTAATPSGESVPTLFLADVAYGYTLKAGTRIVGIPYASSIIGGTEGA